jgi:hypothetical protein
VRGTVVKINKSPLWETVLVYSQDKSILTQLPMDSGMEHLLHGKSKVYCKCHRGICGDLIFGEEVSCSW